MAKTDLVELQAAYDALMDGDKAAPARLCLCLQPLIAAWSKKKVTKHFGMYLEADDLVSEGNAAVLRRIAKLAAKPRITHSNLKGLFSKYIRDAMNTFICREHVIPVSNGGRARGYRPPRVTRLVVPRPKENGGETGGVEIADNFRPAFGGELPPSTVVETVGRVMAACRDETDRAIVRLRLDDDTITQKAIAEQVNLSQQTVGKRLAKLLRRYREGEGQ